jgi:hypothetical protein
VFLIFDKVSVIGRGSFTNQWVDSVIVRAPIRAAATLAGDQPLSNVNMRAFLARAMFQLFTNVMREL